ncbi:hypothetical protein GCM10027456_73460 [Kineosporia babensis]
MDDWTRRVTPWHRPGAVPDTDADRWQSDNGRSVPGPVQDALVRSQQLPSRIAHCNVTQQNKRHRQAAGYGGVCVD